MTVTDCDIIIGIDLGTTNSEVSIVRNGKAIVLKVDGAEIVPSVVSLGVTGDILIGKSAVNNELVAPTNTVRCIKRSMGEELLLQLGEKFYSPPMVSSLILKRLKLAAEEFLGHPVKKAVITVPAFFNEKQREATKEAAELAGLEPVRLLNEPTAAALAYASGKHQGENCLVYDLGGGTFDVSIVNLSSEMMEVKASHGDTALGGCDFDKMIAEQARQMFIHEHSIDLAKDPLAWIRLLRSAEAAKIRLSTEASARMVEEFISTKNGMPLHLNFEITRTQFEAMIKPALERTLVSVRMALDLASLSANDIQQVILVGGATYMPLVSQMLEEELNITPQCWLDSSMVVAMGAAIEAANLAGESIGPVMLDVTPHSLGTSCLDDNFCLYNYILIRRNTPIPCSASKVFYKMYEQQDAVKIDAYQGESKDIHRNTLLGHFVLDGLKNSPGTDIHIKYHLDRSGLLHVTATDIGTGKKESHVLKKMSTSRHGHANLADLASVKINTDQQQATLLEQSLDHILLEHTTYLEVSGATRPDVARQDTAPSLPASFHEEIRRAQLLLEKEELNESDKKELKCILEDIRMGHAEAGLRLADLLYYLE